MRYRYTIGTKRGRWRYTRREAMLDAVKRGHGSVEEWQPEADVEPAIYLHPMVRVEESE